MSTINPAATIELETEDLLFSLSDSSSLYKESEHNIRTPPKRDVSEEDKEESRKVEYGVWLVRSGSRVNVCMYKVVLEEMMEPSTPDFFDMDKSSPLYADMEDILEREKTNQLRLHTYADVWNE